MAVKISVNQAGYVADLPKIASVSGSAKKFFIFRTGENKPCFSGLLLGAVRDTASGDRVLTANFSQFCEEGEFYIKVGSVRSSVFVISKAPYKNLLEDIKKSLYFFRCGSALHRNRAGKFGRKPCHIEPATFYDNKERTLDVSGGWHDAGDYSRCVVTGCVALGHLLYAYSLFPEVFDDKSGISESGRICPLIIEECRYELEWLLKMQDKDGGVYHRVSSLSYAGLVMPSDDKEKQYIFRKTASATALFAAVTALAARIMEPMGMRIIKKLRPAALAAWAWLLNNPDYTPFENDDGVVSPEYSDDFLDDDIFWAASELYSLTGEKVFSDRMEELIGTIDTTGFSIGNVGGFGALSYIKSGCTKNTDILNILKDSLTYRAETICSSARHSGYRSSLSSDEYSWCSNLKILTNAMTVISANTIEGRDEFLTEILGHINYILGNNPLSLSYITGYGKNAVKKPHFRPTIADNNTEAIPGMVVAGPDKNRSDEYSQWLIPYGTPPAKCHLDLEHSHSTNETTIYLNSAATFLFGYISDLCRRDINSAKNKKER